MKPHRHDERLRLVTNTGLAEASLIKEKGGTYMIGSPDNEPNGKTVFDNSLIAYGSNVFHSHTIRNTPLVLAGTAGGRIRQGQQLSFDADIPTANVWYTILKEVCGCPIESFGTCNTVIKEMLA